MTVSATVYRNCCIAFIAAVTALRAAAEPVAEGVDSDTGLHYWEWNADGVLFRLTQRLPDQTRAFFQARDFNAEHADIVARNCVFQSMFRNTGASGSGSVEIDLDEWVVRNEGRRAALLTRQWWKREWASRDVPAKAQIAFEWSLLPTRQSYRPGDYNWGMTSYGLVPGTAFDLEFTWRRDGQHHTGTLKGVECPADIHPDPGAGG